MHLTFVPRVVCSRALSGKLPVGKETPLFPDSSSELFSVRGVLLEEFKDGLVLIRARSSNPGGAPRSNCDEVHHFGYVDPHLKAWLKNIWLG